MRHKYYTLKSGICFNFAQVAPQRCLFKPKLRTNIDCQTSSRFLVCGARVTAHRNTLRDAASYDKQFWPPPRLPGRPCRETHGPTNLCAQRLVVDTTLQMKEVSTATRLHTRSSRERRASAPAFASARCIYRLSALHALVSRMLALSRTADRLREVLVVCHHLLALVSPVDPPASTPSRCP